MEIRFCPNKQIHMAVSDMSDNLFTNLEALSFPLIYRMREIPLKFITRSVCKLLGIITCEMSKVIK